MNIISDLHLHSRFSRACSKDLNIETMEKWARIKGVDLLGTGDFQHPKWQEELRENLSEDDTGILRTETGYPFMLTSEISLIYKQGGKTRKIHNIIWAKDLEVAEQVSDRLLDFGRIDYDGRPIFGMSAPEFVEVMKDVDKDIEVIPAHVWTPWFGLFGSKSGFDSVKEAFQDQTKHIHALETGLSSDPPMNWSVPEIRDYALVSFSDAHSFWPWRLGREATIFDAKKLTYTNIVDAVKNNSIKETIEVNPAYGKYHYDGHRKCGVSMSPQESKKIDRVCPECLRPLTVGVDSRVQDLSEGRPEDVPLFKHLLPLSELLSTVLETGISTKTVWKEYNRLVTDQRSEFDVLLNTSSKELEKSADKRIADAILKNRNQEIDVIPGYDGVYGRPVL